MKKKIFAVSDIHGDFNALIEGLENAGYDENNPNHLLVSLGDAFDRGDYSKNIYEYLKRLSDEGKAVVLRGNHTTFLINYLDGTSISPFNYYNNGLKETLADFLDRTDPFESWWMIDKGNFDTAPDSGDFADWIYEAKEQIKDKYPELLDWIKSRPYYYETKNYIFTHGAIDTEVKNWRKPHCIRGSFTDWEALTWDDGSFFGKDIDNTDKTVVIGHFGTQTLRKMYDIDRDAQAFSILERKDGKVIAIDATTCYSHKVNVLVIEDELL